MITIFNVQRALAAYIESKIFVDTPWRRFLDGDDAAISTAAKQGAKLFLGPRSEGGLGCIACHAGDRFSDEAFHNTGFPQFGRGFGRSERNDLGRWLSTRLSTDTQAFRTPSLLNVARTAPYGHTGAFATLAALLKYHADPAREVEHYDFTLRHLQQFSSGTVQYPEAEQNTRDAIARENFADAQALLPARALADGEIAQLVAFLETLTDSCVATPACISRWAPTLADDRTAVTQGLDRAQGDQRAPAGRVVAIPSGPTRGCAEQSGESQGAGRLDAQLHARRAVR